MTARSVKAILVSAAVLAWGVAAPLPCRGGPAGSATPGAAAATAGTYDVKVGGWVTGAGHSTSSGSSVSISASVEDEGGNKGNLVASGLTVDDKAHFRGTGTVLGQSMTISGRIDSPSAGEKQLKTRRIVGTFVTDDGHYGRIAGFVPPVDNTGSGGGGNGTGGSGSGSGSGTGTGTGGGGGDGGGNGQGNNGNGGNGGNGQGNNGNGGGNGQGNNGNGNGNGGATGSGNGGNGNGGGGVHHGNGKGNSGNGNGNGGSNGRKDYGGVGHRP